MIFVKKKFIYIIDRYIFKNIFEHLYNTLTLRYKEKMFFSFSWWSGLTSFSESLNMNFSWYLFLYIYTLEVACLVPDVAYHHVLHSAQLVPSSGYMGKQLSYETRTFNHVVHIIFLKTQCFYECLWIFNEVLLSVIYM